jgi:putative ABC transport system ATP-binding protein
MEADLGELRVAMIRAVELYRFFHAEDDETFALRGVSIAVRPGEMVAVVGPSGSGKSTLLHCLAGLDEPDGGHVEVDGERLTRRPEAERARIRARSVGVMLQSGNLIEHLTVEGNIRAARAMAGRRSTAAAEILGALGIAHRASARPSTLSGGEAARAGLAVALANDPPVLLADEPTGEVDDASEQVVLALLRGRAVERRSVVVVTHSTAVAEVADRVVNLADGRVVP